MENAKRMETLTDEMGNEVFWSYETQDGRFYIVDTHGDDVETDHFVDVNDVTYSDTDGWLENGNIL